MRSLLIAAVSLAAAAGLAPAPVSAQATSSDLQAELIAQLDDARDKLIQLAEAIPQEKYSWRPGEGVRSVSEALMHVVGANYYFPTLAGVEAPEGLSRDMETTVTDKGEVIAALKSSFEHLRTNLRSAGEADLNQPAKMFGQDTTRRNVYIAAVVHTHEHLGQLIAYARTNGVVPPWSAAAGD
jgi:uncharacterized damage-inducible protein DinB